MLTKVVVLGHTKCGAVAACCGDQAGLDGHLPMLMQKIRPARNSDDPVAENVRIQLQTLQDLGIADDTLVEGGAYIDDTPIDLRMDHISIGDENEDHFVPIDYNMGK